MTARDVSHEAEPPDARRPPEGLEIRPFDGSDRDYEASVAIWNANWPDEPISVEGMKYKDSIRDRRYLFRRLMAEFDGAIAATAIYYEPFWSYAPGKYDIQIRVLPEYQRRGIGGALYEYVMDRLNGLEIKPERLLSDAREDQPHAVRFLTKRGFEQKMRAQVSRLDLASFDPTPFADKVARFEASGLVVKTLEEFEAEDPRAIERLHGKFCEFMKDVPFFEELTEAPLEQFSKDISGPERIRGAFLVVFRGDELVATTSVWKRLGEPGALNTGLTAVARSHRRRGIATAIKVRSIGFAKGLGYRVIQTDNEENNPMYDLNVRLGFRPVPAWLLFRKVLVEGAGS
jgi:GNAT superfamily N-acetyltransferase